MTITEEEHSGFGFRQLGGGEGGGLGGGGAGGEEQGKDEPPTYQ